ncbi:DUF4232 domain-containing protein [Pseudonocardiaceae bacterium YIM PH 21723]|nr:DUF4232 domain-containing protein [Pseudonocardiaceae bacterium YIM PH 21723]
MTRGEGSGMGKAAKAIALLTLSALLVGCGAHGRAIGARMTHGLTTTSDFPPEFDDHADNLCPAGGFAAALRTLPGQSTAVLALTNTGARPCVVGGWVEVAFLNAAGIPAGLLAERVELPGPAEDVLVDPGLAAYAAIRWESCHPGELGCSTINSSVVTAPAGDGMLPAGVTDQDGVEVPEVTARSVQVGTLQPSQDDALDW